MYQITIEGIVKAKGKILFLSNGAFQKQLIVVHTKKEKHPVYEIQSLGDMVDQTMNIKIGRKYQFELEVMCREYIKDSRVRFHISLNILSFKDLTEEKMLERKAKKKLELETKRALKSGIDMGPQEQTNLN